MSENGEITTERKKAKGRAIESLVIIMTSLTALIGGIMIGGYMERNKAKQSNQDTQEGTVKNGSFVVKDPYAGHTIFITYNDPGERIVSLYNFNLVEPYANDPSAMWGWDIISNQHATHFGNSEDDYSQNTIFRPYTVMVKSVNDEEGRSFTDRNGYDYFLKDGIPFLASMHEWGRSHVKVGKELIFYYPLIGDLVWVGEERKFIFKEGSGAVWERSFKRGSYRAYHYQ